MGWRERLEAAMLEASWVKGDAEYSSVSVDEVMMARLMTEWPPADRIALARELLAGTGRVVAREVDEYGPEYDDATREGWNACRAAMLAGTGHEVKRVDRFGAEVAAMVGAPVDRQEQARVIIKRWEDDL